MIPKSIKGYNLCGIGFTEDQRITGKYYERKYCGRTNASPEYIYFTEGDETFSSYPKIKRYSLMPCLCGCGKSQDKCDK